MSQADPGTNGTTYALTDKVDYRDTAPWPAAADGYGASLHRLSSAAYGNDAGNWFAGTPTPGSAPGGGAAPQIIVPPANVQVLLGNNTGFSLGASGANLRYQWRAFGTNLAGATNAALVLNNVQYSQVGAYHAAVFNAGGSAVSAPATLAVLGPVVITLHPTNQNVLPGTNVTLVASASGSGPVRYQWQFNGTNILNATNASHSFTGANLTNHHGSFSVVASDSISSATSSNAFIYVLVKPGFVQGLAPFSVLQGSTFTLSVVATGAPPIWYRWIRASAPFATTSVPFITITNYQVTTVPTSQFRVGVTNAASPAGVFSPVAGNIIISMISDFDGDGLADAWEATYFGSSSTNSAANAARDSDGDGMTNLDEYRAGTDPTNALSVLKVIFTATNGNVLSFVAQTGLTYSVQWRTNLTAPAWTNLTSINGSPLVRTVTVNRATAPAGVERYFRVVTPLVP